MPITKTEQVKKLVASGEYKKALQIVKTFRRLMKKDYDAMLLSYECMTHPDFYRQLGYDVDAKIQEGINVLISLYA